MRGHGFPAARDGGPEANGREVSGDLLKPRGESHVGRETKVGLIVGLAFIVLFGIILSSRASTQATADLPTGTSRQHQMTIKTLGRDVDPFPNNSTIELPKDAEPGRTDVAEHTAPPREEPLRAPEDLKVTEPDASRAEEVGRLAFGPARTETPDREYEQPAPKDADETAEKPGGKEKAGEPAPKTYTVVKGDTLASIARKVYGPDGERQWRRLYEANKKTVKDPSRLLVGKPLVVPVIPGPATAVKAPDPAASGVAELSAKGAADPSAKPTLKSALTQASRDGVPEVTAEEIGRMYGSKSDLVESPTAPPQTYTVQPGDTFSRIGSKLYGDAKYGKLLLLRNQHLVPDETKLQIGQRILLLDGVEINRTM
jgi:nucleoid-associated protein YgaU